MHTDSEKWNNMLKAAHQEMSIKWTNQVNQSGTAGAGAEAVVGGAARFELSLAKTVAYSSMSETGFSFCELHDVIAFRASSYGSADIPTFLHT